MIIYLLIYDRMVTFWVQTAVNWTPWFCRDFPHFFQEPTVILPIFYRDFNASLIITLRDDIVRQRVPNHGSSNRKCLAAAEGTQRAAEAQQDGWHGKESIGDIRHLWVDQGIPRRSDERCREEILTCDTANKSKLTFTAILFPSLTPFSSIWLHLFPFLHYKIWGYSCDKTPILKTWTNAPPIGRRPYKVQLQITSSEDIVGEPVRLF